MQQISVLLHTSEHRGDHAADIIMAIQPKEGETVVELVDRLLGPESRAHATDHIELRVVA